MKKERKKKGRKEGRVADGLKDCMDGWYCVGLLNAGGENIRRKKRNPKKGFT